MQGADEKMTSTPRPRALSALEEQFARDCRAAKLPIPEREYRFDQTRKWRMDFAWPAHKLAVEIEGGVWSNGRHTRGSGFVADCEKYNAAALLGWRVLRFTGEHVTSGRAIAIIDEVLSGCPHKKNKSR